MVRKESVPLSGTISKREKTSMTTMTTEFSAVHIQKKKANRKTGFHSVDRYKRRYNDKQLAVLRRILLP